MPKNKSIPREESIKALRAQRYGIAKVVKTATATEPTIKEVKRAIEVDHIVITKFRNDATKPTLFANAEGKFVSVDNKEGFAKANKEGTLKLTLEEATKIVTKKGFKGDAIEISPAFTLEQFKKLIAE